MVIDSVAGSLTMDVASEGNIIRKGTEVVVREVVDNFKNLSVEVVSTRSTVRLPFYGTFIKQLVEAKKTDGLEGYWIYDAYEEEYVYIPTAEELA